VFAFYNHGDYTRTLNEDKRLRHAVALSPHAPTNDLDDRHV